MNLAAGKYPFGTPEYGVLNRILGMVLEAKSFPNGSSYKQYERRPYDANGRREARERTTADGWHVSERGRHEWVLTAPTGTRFEVFFTADRGQGADFGAHYYTQSEVPETSRFVVKAL